MSLFGIGGRAGKAIALGNITQQSLGSSTATTTTRLPETTLGPSTRRTGGSTEGNISTARTISPAFITPEISRGIQLPPIAKFVPPQILPPKKIYQQDSLRVSEYKFVDGEFRPVEKNGISVFRPEIISMFDFQPVDGNGKLGDKNPTESTEQLIKSQYQALEIRGLTISRIITDMRRNRDFRLPLENANKLFVKKLTSTRVALEYYSGIIEKVNQVKVSLDPKQIAATAFDTKKFLPIFDFYERKMQYSKSRVLNFSDTKIINQMVSDLRNILEGYSFSLLDLTDSDRGSDINPIKIDKSYTQNSGFSFNVASLRSGNQGNILAFKPATFNQFLNSVPNLTDDRVKLLTTILSKELRISKQMGKTEVARILREKYSQDNSSNPFDNICGNIGDTIFDAPSGLNSLATLAFGETPSENVFVLPFENFYVDSQDERKVFVPGSSYFGDNILNITTSGFNIDPYISYAARFDKIVTTAKTTIETLLEINEASNLSPEILLDNFLLSISQASSGLVSSANIDKSQAFCSALLKLANTDTTLKNMLFEYVLLLGLATTTNTDQKKIFERLATEIGSIQTFSYAKIDSTGQPNLLGGLPVLRPYIENIANQIEQKVFELIYPINFNNLNKNILELIPSLNPSVVLGGISSPINILNGVNSLSKNIGAVKKISNLGLDGYLMNFQNGQIKETLINVASVTNSASTNMFKEFIDLCVKFDQYASISANPTYLVGDLTYRTRFNFFSVSTVMLLVFEILSSLVQKYTFSDFDKGTYVTNGNIIINTSYTNNVMQAIKETIAISEKTKFDVAKNAKGIAGSPFDILVGKKETTNTFSINSADISRESIISPQPTGFAPGRIATTSVMIAPKTFAERVNPNTLKTLANTPLLSFGNQNLDIPGMLRDATKIIEFKKNIQSIRNKLIDETTIVQNLLHIFEVFNKQFSSTKEMVSRTFTLESLNTFLRATELTIDELQLVKNPSQVKTSFWLYDKYDEKLTEATTSSDTDEVGLGFLITDRIPLGTLNAMFSMLAQPMYGHKNAASRKVKILSVGIPAGFSEHLSDRVERTSISSANYKEKQFDVITLNVYKRDARYDDLVFKPQKFFFDLSLFPTKNILPASTERFKINYSDIIQQATLKDYKAFQDKRNLTLGNILRDSKYSFLSNAEREQMVKNHIESYLFEIYFKLLTGVSMTEETFTEVFYNKINSQDVEITNLILNYLKVVRGKTIPALPLSQMLTSTSVDQETKDIIRLLSYGNIMFQPSFVKNRILQPKLFDRVFNIPVDLEEFEIDTELTLATESGRLAFNKNSVQEQLENIGGKVYLKSKNVNQAMFEDLFIVIESNLRNGI